MENEYGVHNVIHSKKAVADFASYIARFADVMGAFGKHHFEPLRESTAGRLVKTINLPLFIAHHQ